MDKVTEDSLLGGRVLLRQPADGYRAAIDPVMMAAAVPVADGQTVLDVGCGVGAAALCLAARVPGCRVVGVEIQPDYAQLARDNVTANQMVGRVDVLTANIAAPPPRLAPGSFHHVMSNPPYLPAAGADAPPNAGKATAHVEGEVELAAWVKFCLTMLRHKGTLVMVYRADRLDALLAALHANKAGDIAILPLWPKAGRPAKRVVVRARKGVASPTTLLPGLVLHEEDGRFTPLADAILRDGVGME